MVRVGHRSVHRMRQNMDNQSSTPIGRKVAVQTLIAGIIAAVLCVFTSYFGFVSRLALCLRRLFSCLEWPDWQTFGYYVLR